jgi:hypothetical protein
MGRDAIYFPDEKTIVIGREQQVKDAITRGPTSNIAERFSFLSKGHIVMGALPEDLAKLKQNLKPQGMAGMMFASKPYVAQITEGLQDLQGGGLAVTFGSGVELEVLAKCASSDGAGKISAGLSDMLSDFKSELNKNRDMINQMGGPMKEGAEIAEMLVNSMDAGRSGDTASLSLEVSSSAIDKIESIATQAGGGGLPRGFNLPKIPGLGNMFGGGGGGGGFGEAGDRATDMNKLKQIGVAMHNYHDTHRTFPGGGQSQLSWRVHILPFVGHAALYQQFHINEPWNSQHNMALIPLMPDIYRRPGSGAAPGKTNYVGIDGPGGIMENGGGKRIPDITDGVSNTILVTEVLDHAAVTWTQPIDYRYNPSNPLGDLGGWNGGFHALFADGSVRFLARVVNPQTLLGLFTRNGNEPIGAF